MVDALSRKVNPNSELCNTVFLGNKFRKKLTNTYNNYYKRLYRKISPRLGFGLKVAFC